MDPDAALSRILEILADENPDREELVITLEGLAEWIDEGGFLPLITYGD